MNRLQKKCLVATAGFHLLLLLAVVFGAAFFTQRTHPDETELLTVIPSKLIEAAFNSGVKDAQVPAPKPLQPIQPPQPKPVVTPPPAPTLVEKVKDFFKPAPAKPVPDDVKPVETPDKPAKPSPKKIEVNLKPVSRNTAKATPDTSEADANREAANEAKKRAAAIAKALASINKNASSATTIEMPGASSVSYANYASAIKSIYEQAWTPPQETASDDANTKVSITIRNDGTVITSRIVNPSGDAQVDASVQRALDRVALVPAFPDGAKEKERTFKINFNLKAKRMPG